MSATAAPVEERAIAAAAAYAAANGYAQDDRKAIGLVLVGLAIASLLDDDTRRDVARGYLAAFPGSHPAVARWVAFIEDGAR